MAASTTHATPGEPDEVARGCHALLADLGRILEPEKVIGAQHHAVAAGESSRVGDALAVNVRVTAEHPRGQTHTRTGAAAAHQHRLPRSGHEWAPEKTSARLRPLRHAPALERRDGSHPIGGFERAVLVSHAFAGELDVLVRLVRATARRRYARTREERRSERTDVLQRESVDTLAEPIAAGVLTRTCDVAAAPTTVRPG